MITLECNYSKKIGLPGFSSHQFSVSLKTEITDLAQVQAESNRLYQLLQNGVDASIQQVGYLPAKLNGKGNGHENGNGNGHTQTDKGPWNCSDKQKELILKIVTEHKLEKSKVEALSQDRFGKSVRVLNKLEASGLIEELLEMTGQGRSQGRQRFQKAGGR